MNPNYKHFIQTFIFYICNVSFFIDPSEWHKAGYGGDSDRVMTTRLNKVVDISVENDF